jgi:hypothetical protein
MTLPWRVAGPLRAASRRCVYPLVSRSADSNMLHCAGDTFESCLAALA